MDRLSAEAAVLSSLTSEAAFQGDRGRAFQAIRSISLMPDVAYARFRLAGEEVSALARRAELEDLESPLDTAAAEALQHRHALAAEDAHLAGLRAYTTILSGSAPPGMKSFWMSMRSSARMRCQLLGFSASPRAA